MEFLPFYRPLIGEEEKKEVLTTLSSDWLSRGPVCRLFERKLSRYIGCKYVKVLNSCTAGLDLGLMVCGIRPGDEVITTPLTFCATVNAIVHQKATPVFVDIDPKTFNLDVDKIERKITKKTRAIIPVHYGGQPCDIDKILVIAKKHNLKVIEDAAHAIGSEYKGIKIGNFGDITSFSFHAIKNMTTGEGGAIATNKKALIDKIEIGFMHGIDRDAYKRYGKKAAWYYEVLLPGYKYNMDDIHASIGVHQLRKLDFFIKKRQSYAAIYDRAFSEIPQIFIPTVKRCLKHSRHLYPILLNLEMLNISRDNFIEELKDLGIGTTVNYIPVYKHRYYKKSFPKAAVEFKNAEYVFKRTISLPLYPRMAKSDVERVIESVDRVVKKHIR